MKRILLACNQGMSTSLLVQKLRAEAAAEGKDYVIDALPFDKALDVISVADVFLLGPQIAYQKGNAEASAGDTPVAVIAMTDYGRMNAKKILADAENLMEGR